MRKKTREVRIGDRVIGGEAPILVQSMCNTDTRDAAATIRQILALEEAGCEIIRVAVPDEAAAEALPAIRKGIHIPLVADIHFDYRLALAALAAGVDKIRINPGNIGDAGRVRQVVEEAKARGVAIRVGVNSGSLEKDILAKYGGPTPEGLVESALRHVEILEHCGFYDTVISLKGSDVPLTIAAYEEMSRQVAYPLQVGVTEAGTVWAGTIKSAAGIGAILARGLGDTIRVSLTGDPVEEVRVGREILKAMGLRRFGPTLVSCPTCGRTQIDLIGIARQVEERCQSLDKDIKVAVMGCVVNGPGEAREADVGIAGGRGVGMVFRKGEVIRTVPEADLVNALFEEIERMK